MIPKRLRMYMAGLIAFLIGVPLTGKVMAISIGDLIGGVIDIGIDASGES